MHISNSQTGIGPVRYAQYIEDRNRKSWLRSNIYLVLSNAVDGSHARDLLYAHCSDHSSRAVVKALNCCLQRELLPFCNKFRSITDEITIDS